MAETSEASLTLLLFGRRQPDQLHKFAEPKRNTEEILQGHNCRREPFNLADGKIIATTMDFLRYHKYKLN